MSEDHIYTANDLFKIKEEFIKTRYEINNSIDFIHITEDISSERIKRIAPENLSKDYTLMISILDAILDNPLLV